MHKSVNDDNDSDSSEENEAYQSQGKGGKKKTPLSPFGGKTTRASDISQNEGRNPELFKSDYSNGAPTFGQSL